MGLTSNKKINDSILVGHEDFKKKITVKLTELNYLGNIVNQSLLTKSLSSEQKNEMYVEGLKIQKEIKSILINMFEYEKQNNIPHEIKYRRLYKTLHKTV